MAVIGLKYIIPLPKLSSDQPKGWYRAAVMPLADLAAHWRTFILLNNGYGILPDGKTVGRFRREIRGRGA